MENFDIIIDFLKTRKLDYLLKVEEREIERIWEIRRNLSPSLKKLAPKKISDDVVVPRSKMKDFLFFLRDLEKKFKIYISAFGHIGDGNFHVNILHQEGEDTFALKIREAILRKVLELGGTLSGEHGVGYSKLPYVIWELSPVQIELMKGIKKVFDPKGILNPHIKVPEMSFFSK
ncbi:MAG: FAD-linked oxidase C-terminal domain-containing protein [Thermodesulfobacteriaceae bacterium]|nr:FAD-linked oxidase C-terminal domain-containing protein [Thermodesulfobacteriaceae bacterium]